MEGLPTENSYIDFNNDCDEFDREDFKPQSEERCNTEGMEITTEIDYFQFTANIPEKSEGISIACGTITRRTAHFSANGSHEKEEGPA